MPAVPNPRWLRIALFVARLFLGLVFLYAAYTKLWTIEFNETGFGLNVQMRPWAIFAMSINSYNLLPEWAAIMTARALPWLELALGLLLISGLQLRWVAAAASALLLFFLGVMIRSYALGLGIDCGCFGVGEALSKKTLFRDSALAALSIAVAVTAFVAARRSAQEAATQS